MFYKQIPFEIFSYFIQEIWSCFLRTFFNFWKNLNQISKLFDLEKMQFSFALYIFDSIKSSNRGAHISVSHKLYE